MQLHITELAHRCIHVPTMTAVTLVQTFIYTPIYSGFHPHISTHTTAHATFLTLLHKAVG